MNARMAAVMVGSPIARLAVQLAPEGMICMGSVGRHARLVSALPDGGEALCGGWMREPKDRLGEDLDDRAAVLFLDGLVTMDLAAAVGRRRAPTVRWAGG
jgi:hypothetical protein